MKILRSVVYLLLIAILFLSGGCSSKTSPTRAIDSLRKSLSLPASALKFVENARDPNSPSGGLQVARYQDADGRIYSVNLGADQVVEMDARALLSKIPADASSLPQEEIQAQALKFAKAVIPNFDSIQSLLQYEEGGKIDNYFFTWYGEMSPSGMNRPQLQFGFYKNGFLFAYYNTLSIKK